MRWLRKDTIYAVCKLFLIYATVTAMRSVLWPRICRKCVCGGGLALDPTGGAHDALQTHY